MSRETLDGDGAGQPPVAGEAAGSALDLDLSLDDAAPAAPAAPAAAALPPGRVDDRGPARLHDGPGGDLPDLGDAVRPDLRDDPRDGIDAGIDAGIGDLRDLDGFSADLGEERVDRKSAARAAGLPLTRADRRRVRQAAVAAGVVLLLVLAAVGGYSEGQKARDRESLASARVVGQMDENSLSRSYTQDGRLSNPVLLSLHLTITAPVTATVTRVVLPTGEARLHDRVRLTPGAGVDAQLELSDVCGKEVRQRPSITDTTVTLLSADGTETTLPLQLGFEKQFLSRDGLCGPSVSSGDGTDANELITVTDMWVTRSGDLTVALQSRTPDRLQVAVGPSQSGSAQAQGWQVSAVPPGPVFLTPNGTVDLVVRLSRDGCFRDDTLPLATNLVALRISSAAVGQDPVEVDGVGLNTWNDTAVSGAAAARMALLCRR